MEKTLAEIRKLHEELNAELYGKPTERPTIQSPSDAFNILLPFLGPLDHEELWVINLDTRNRVMSLTKLYQGSVNQSQVRVSEVFRQAITDNAPASSSPTITLPGTPRLHPMMWLSHERSFRLENSWISKPWTILWSAMGVLCP